MFNLSACIFKKYPILKSLIINFLIQEVFEAARPTIKFFLFAVTQPTQKNCRYPKIFIGLPVKDFFFYFMFSDSVFQFLLYCPSKRMRMCSSIQRSYLLEGMVNRIYPPELQLNKANTSDTKAPFLDLHFPISNGFVSSKIYDKRDDFDLDIVNFPFLDGDIPRSTSYGVYISQLIRFARVSSHVADFNSCNKSLTAKLLQQGYLYPFERLSPNFIANTMNWFLNSMLD